MTPERRRQGRAIRKRRREQAEAFAAVDWKALSAAVDQVAAALTETMAAFGKAIQSMSEFVVAVWAEWYVQAEAHARKVHRATTVVNMDC